MARAGLERLLVGGASAPIDRAGVASKMQPMTRTDAMSMGSEFEAGTSSGARPGLRRAWVVPLSNIGGPRIICLGLIALSFAVCSLLVIADAGIRETPYETRDSLGRAMGFNDPLSLEHYAIILSNFRLTTLFTAAYAYAWVLLGMHAVGAGLLLRSRHLGKARVRWFFAVQGVVFPLGWFGFLAIPLTLGPILTGTFDREGIIDVPFVTLTAQPVWLLTALVIWWTCRNQATPDSIARLR
jgi:hypothetical protein